MGICGSGDVGGGASCAGDSVSGVDSALSCDAALGLSGISWGRRRGGTSIDGAGDCEGVWNAVRDSAPWLSKLRCDSCEDFGSMNGLRRCGGSSGGPSSFLVKTELVLLCAVPGLSPRGDWSRRGEGYPFCLRGSGGGRPGGAPSYGGSSTDLCDRCDCPSSPKGRRPGLKLEGTFTDSGVFGRLANSEVED